MIRDIECDFTIEDFKISGYAAVYNTLSKDLGNYREVISVGAFDEVLASNSNVLAVLDHSREVEKVLGSTESGTLKLNADDKGLHFELDTANTTAGKNLITLIKRGDIKSMSFAFVVAEDGEKWDTYGYEMIRTIDNFAELNDISIVTIPAYEDALIA